MVSEYFSVPWQRDLVFRDATEAEVKAILSVTDLVYREG